jgi:hypothetical protein
VMEAWLRLGCVAAGAFALMLAAWPARRFGGVGRGIVLLTVALGILTLPLLIPREQSFFRIFAFLGVGAPLIPKILDLNAGRARWRTLSFSRWVAFLANPLVLVERVHALRRPMPRGPAALLAMRGALEVASGILLLMWSMRAHLTPLWLDHVVKLAAGYLLVFDGAFVLLTGLWRLFGSPVMDLSLDPVLAVTPADFWRRYNCSAGRFFHDDLFLPCGGRRHPVLGMIVVFAVNGIFHEALAFLLVGRIQGYQLAFFALQGAAVILTYRFRPRGALAVVSWAATLVFNIATSALFFASIHAGLGWWNRGS